jgi:hypothetical protein
MARAPMKLDLKKNQMHKDVKKAPGAKITEVEGRRLRQARPVCRERQEVESLRKG